MCPYLCTDEILVSEAVHLPVQLKHTLLSTSTHEVEVILAGGETAAHGGSGLPTAVTALQNEGQESC